MQKLLWFVGGFIVTLGLLAAGGLWAIHDLNRPSAAAAVAPTVTLPGHAFSPAETPTPQPFEHADALLAWSSQGIEADACARLEIDAARQAHFGRCGEGLRLAPLSQAELESLLLYLVRYRPFDYAVLEDAATPTEQAVQVAFRGQGGQTANPQVRANISAWAAQVYGRLAATETREDLQARCRVDLAARLGIAPEQVRPLQMREVRWPDACLGIREAGVYCARVPTTGYQITLLADDQVYEYRADTYGKLRATMGVSEPYLLPPLVE
ncbi:MAG: hypothetical protein GXY68_06225 [Chloroflexi bacterium]|nr:hypothetical protein [Chloroflexota bacterium]